MVTTSPSAGAGGAGSIPALGLAALVDWFDGASPDHLQAGIDWYPQARRELRRIARRHRVDVVRLTYAVAAISPRLQWATNLRAAEELAATGTASVGLLTNRRRAERCMRGEVECVRGRKVVAFARNLLGDLSVVTLDTWAIRAAIGRDAVTPRQRAGVEAAYRELARMRDVAPAQAQAVVWVAIRGGAS